MADKVAVRSRAERVAAATSVPTRWTRFTAWIVDRTVSTRIALCVVTACAWWGIMGAWAPPFPYRAGDLPSRDIVARIEFDIVPSPGLRLVLDVEEQQLGPPSAATEAIRIERGQVLARAFHPLTPSNVRLLKAEHYAWLADRAWGEPIGYGIAAAGMFSAVFILCGVYLYYHHQDLLQNMRRFLSMLGFSIALLAAAKFASVDSIRAEVVPLLLFAMTARVVLPREPALLLAAVATVLVVLELGQDLGEFIIAISSVFTAILLLNHVRTRTKLLVVGVATAAITILTAVGVGTLMGQTYGVAGTWEWFEPTGDLPIKGVAFIWRLLAGATWIGFGAVLAGTLMTGLLPLVERLFDTQTDLSLLELGDPRNALLQELARKAPGTFSHSLNVASLAGAAAEAIGANGLLARVGAYFHDIGKMLNPKYFAENQTLDEHANLAPTVSKLVIISHVKDGVKLAMRHGLPRVVIDFIEQHHGTTVVEFFYRRAAANQAADPGAPEVDDADFRYPGPKPQTREAAVVMIADTAESACRTLTDPAPARIQHLVHELIEKKMKDRQFDECPLTMRELGVIEQTIVKSLNAFYHARVAYPSTQEEAKVPG